LTTGKIGASDLDITTGTYVASICVDEEGNITLLSATPSTTVQSGDNNPVTSDAVANAISSLSVEANPQGSATDTLNKLEVGGTIYSVSEVEGNTGETPSQPLTDISIDGTVYSIPEVVGNSGETPSQTLSDLKIDGTVYSVGGGSSAEVIYKTETINHNNTTTRTMASVALQANSIYLMQLTGKCDISGRTTTMTVNFPSMFGGTTTDSLSFGNSYTKSSTSPIRLIRTTSAINHAPTLTPNPATGNCSYQRLYIKIG
jgi:hypothetical protein